MSDGVIQLRHAFLRWPLCVSVIVTLCATLIVGRAISSALHQSMELRSIELARSIDGGALITRNRGYLQNLVAGLSAYGTTATVLVAQGEPAVIVAASNPKLIGTSLESLADVGLRDAMAAALRTGSFSSSARIGFDRTVAVLPLVPASRQIRGQRPRCVVHLVDPGLALSAISDQPERPRSRARADHVATPCARCPGRS
jgi:hypothetical protein